MDCTDKGDRICPQCKYIIEDNEVIRCPRCFKLLIFKCSECNKCSFGSKGT